MTDVQDRRGLGDWPLRDHRSVRPELRNVPRGVVVVDRDLYGRYVVQGHGDGREHGPSAYGDLQGAGFVGPTPSGEYSPPVNAPDLPPRKAGSFFFAIPAVVVTGEPPPGVFAIDDATQTRLRRSVGALPRAFRRTVTVRPLLDGATVDTRYAPLTCAVADRAGSPSIEEGAHGVVLFGTRERRQEPIFLPTGDGSTVLMAPSAQSHTALGRGTPVHDLRPDGSPDPARFSRLQEFWRVLTGGRLAWKIGPVVGPVIGATDAVEGDAREVWQLDVPRRRSRGGLFSRTGARYRSDSDPDRVGPLAFDPGKPRATGYAQFMAPVYLRHTGEPDDPWTWEAAGFAVPFGDRPPPKKPKREPPPPWDRRPPPPPGGDPPPDRGGKPYRKPLGDRSGFGELGGRGAGGRPTKPGANSLLYRIGPDHLLQSQAVKVPLGQGGQPVGSAKSLRAARYAGHLDGKGRLVTQDGYATIGDSPATRARKLGGHDRRPVVGATQVFLGGVDYGAQETRRDRPALALGAEARPQDEKRARCAPVVGSVRGMAASGDGAWPKNPCHDKRVSRGVDGTIVPLPPDLGLVDALNGLPSPGGLRHRTTYADGLTETFFGTLDQASGAAVTGVRRRHTGGSGIDYVAIDSAGAEGDTVSIDPENDRITAPSVELPKHGSNPMSGSEYGVFVSDGTEPGTVDEGLYYSKGGTLRRLDDTSPTPGGIVDGRTMVDHFFVGDTTSGSIGAFGWALTTANGGTFAASATLPGRFGVANCLVTTASGSKSYLTLGLVGGIGSAYEFGSGKAAYFEATVRINSGGSLTDADVVCFGLADALNPADCLIVEFDPSVASTWALHAEDSTGGPGVTRVQSGTEVAAATWYRVGFSINAAGTSAQLYINGSSSGSAITTNLPTSADTLGLVIGLTGAAGVASISVTIDEVSVTVET